MRKPSEKKTKKKRIFVDIIFEKKIKKLKKLCA